MVLQVSEDMLSELYDIIGQYPKAEKYSLKRSYKQRSSFFYLSIYSFLK